MSLRNLISEKEGWFWPTEDTGCWDYMHQHPDIPDKLAQYVGDRGVVVQAGGNCGFYIKRYSELFRRVYTFEPDPTNFLCLTLNCDSPNVFKFQSCLGSEPGLYSLVIAQHDVGATHIGGSGIIPTITVDELGLDACDLLQLDTEGFEYFALLGARKTIARYRPVISVEWCGPWAARYGVTLQMVEDFLDEWNYKLVAEHESDRVYITK